MQLNEKTDKIMKKIAIASCIASIAALLMVAILVFIVFQVNPQVLAY